MRNLFVIALLTMPILVGGCDSLHARMKAQDGVSLYKAGELAKAQEKFAEAAKLDPRIATIQLDLGFASLAVYQNAPTSGSAAAEQAIGAFEKFLELRPKEERARVFLIQTFVDTGRYDDAVAFFKPAVEKTPPDPQALNTLGIIASKTGKYDDARKWYEKRIEADPQNPEARLALGVLLWDHLHSRAEIVGADRLALADVAITQLGEAIKLAPKAPSAYMYTNLVYRERAIGEVNDDGKRKDLEQAQKFFSKAMSMQKGGH